MAITYEDISVKCPFYASSGKLTITCEGVIENTEMMNRFRTAELRMEHQKSHCFRYPNDCPIAKEIEAQYEQRKVI